MSLTLRAFNVLFGDCLLLSWDEDDGVHHAWIDFGNFHNDRNEVFRDVYAQARQLTGGVLDLVVITHRHLDHLEGFHSLRREFARDFKIDRLWHAHVTPAVDDQFQIAQAALTGALPAYARSGSGEIARIFQNNFGAAGSSTADKMADILATLPARGAHAVHRKTRLSSIRPAGMKRLRVQVLAPEPDSRVYLQPLQDALAGRATLDGYFRRAGQRAGARRAGRGGGRKGGPSGPRSGADPFVLPPGRKASSSRLLRLADFARLRRELRAGGLDLLGAVDRTRNNTSLVLAITYNGTRLLLAADAEEQSWQIMRRNRARLGATVIKVGHHGSRNASPAWCFEKVLRQRRAANAAVVSTCPDRFTGVNPVPYAAVLAGWRGRLTSATRLLRTDDKALGQCVEVRVDD